MEENYRTDIVGNQYYTENSPGLVIFIKRNGDEIYAKDKFSREYYPSTGQVAKTKDGKPIYAIGPNGNVIFMKNENGDEIYIKDDDKNDYVKPNMRYAKKADKSTYYPTLKNENGQYFEKLLKKKYAKDSNNKLFYPLDDMGHERWYEEVTEQPDEYPITNDNYYLVPQKDGKPYFMDNLEPKLTMENIKFILERTDGSINYVTSVQSRSRKSRGIFKPYDTKPFGVIEDSNDNVTSNKDNSDKKMEKPDKKLENDSSASKNSNGDDDSDLKPDTNLVDDSKDESSESEDEDKKMEIDENNEEKSTSDKSNGDEKNEEKSNSDKSNDEKSPKIPKINKHRPVTLTTNGLGIFSNNGGGLSFYFILTALITIIFGMVIGYLKIRQFF